MIHKNHDEVFQELCKEFPGLMDYLMDGHLKEVGKLTEKVRELGNALASADARCDERLAEANFLVAVNKKYEDILRRVGMMMDAEALKDLVDTDLVPCGLPVTVALDLATVSRPLIVAQGEKELGATEANKNGDVFDPAIFKLHQEGKLADSTMLKMVMGIDPGLARDKTVIAPVVKQEGPLHPGHFIEQVGNLKSFAVQYAAESRPDMTIATLRSLADALLSKFGWACIDVVVNGRGSQSIDIDIVARELDGVATSIDAEVFAQEFRAVVQRMLLVSAYIDEITIRSSLGGRPVLLPASSSPTSLEFTGKKVKW